MFNTMEKENINVDVFNFIKLLACMHAGFKIKRHIPKKYAMKFYIWLKVCEMETYRQARMRKIQLKQNKKSRRNSRDGKSNMYILMVSCVVM